MKLFFNTLILFSLVFSNSCESQEKNEQFSINYSAQTRGYSYTLLLNNNELEIQDNAILKKVELNKEQLNKIYKEVSTIDFNKIENNISNNDLALDRSIEGVFNIKFENKSYTFNLDHHKLPKEIKNLISELEALVN